MYYMGVSLPCRFRQPTAGLEKSQKIDRVGISLLNYVPMLHDASSVEPVHVHNRRRFSSPHNIHAVVNKRNAVVKDLAQGGEFDGVRRENGRKDMKRVLPAAEGVRVVLDVVLRHVVEQSLGGVSFLVEGLRELAKDRTLLLLRGCWPRRAVGHTPQWLWGEARSGPGQGEGADAKSEESGGPHVDYAGVSRTTVRILTR